MAVINLALTDQLPDVVAKQNSNNNFLNTMTLITGAGYAVKKYDNGFMEMYAGVSLSGTVGINITWGSLFISNIIAGSTFPVAFTKILNFEQHILPLSDGDSCFLMSAGTPSITVCAPFHLVSATSKTIGTPYLEYTATGWWK